VNHLSAVLLTILLLPCLLKAASSGTSPNPRVVIVASDVHYWTKFSKTEVESEKILRKLSDKDHCTSPWGRSLPYLTVIVTPLFQGHEREIYNIETFVNTQFSRDPLILNVFQS
jgi:hypothetical protein